ncbi:zinc finger protein 121-like [Ptychodera flava]|uniref:zinc finger protein 121-like n=1 Tax=Ptychodera flava TaxID=63121 RepID=UPI003969F4BE
MAAPAFPVAIWSTQTKESEKQRGFSIDDYRAECLKVWENARHHNDIDKFKEAFEVIVQKITVRFQENILSAQDKSIIINSLAELCCISTEHADGHNDSCQCNGNFDKNDNLTPGSSKTSPLETHINIPSKENLANSEEFQKTCMRRVSDLPYIHVCPNGTPPGDNGICQGYHPSGNMRSYLEQQIRERPAELQHLSEIAQDENFKGVSQRHVNEELNECKACGEMFGDQTSLKNHLLSHLTGKSQNPECGEMFQTREVTSQHGNVLARNETLSLPDIQVADVNEENKRLEECFLDLFHSDSGFRQHVQDTLQSKDQINDKSVLSKHVPMCEKEVITVGFPQINESLGYEDCGRIREPSSFLKINEEESHLQGQLPERDLNERNAGKHAESMVPYKCQCCGKAFYLKGMPKYTQDGYLQQTVACNECQDHVKTYNVTPSHRTHLDRLQVEGKPNPVQGIGDYREFAQSVGPYKSSMCGKSVSLLKCHNGRSHQQTQKQLECKVCGYIFKRKSSLHRHVKQFHTEGAS